MPRHLLFKMLMQQADASPGSGSATGATTDKPADIASGPSDAGTQAQGQGAGQTVSAEALTKMFTDLKNSVEASTRRMIEGALGKKTGKSGSKSNESRAPATDDDASQSTTQAEPDMRALDRAAGRALRQLDAELSDRQYARMERDFKAEAPTDVGTWVSEWLADIGITKKDGGTGTAQQQQTAQQSTQQNNNQAPDSGKDSAVAKPPPTAAPKSNVPFVDAPQDPTKWTSQQMADFFVREGGDPFDVGNPKNAKVWKKVAEMYQQVGARTRLVSR